MKKLKYLVVGITLLIVISVIILSTIHSSDQPSDKRKAEIEKYITIATREETRGNHAAAFEAIKTAAVELNDPRSQNLLSSLYHSGKGVAKDEILSKKYLEMSAENGYADSQYQVGLLNLIGSGGYTQNVDESFRLLLLAAEQDHMQAQYYTAQNYMIGIGVESDFNKAEYWFLRSADKGYAMAQYELGKLYINRAKVETNTSMKEKLLNKAVGYFIAAADQGHEEAQKVVRNFR